MLKAAGVSDFIAREIVGHESRSLAAIHASHYRRQTCRHAAVAGRYRYLKPIRNLAPRWDGSPRFLDFLVLPPRRESRLNPRFNGVRAKSYCKMPSNYS